MYYIPRAEFTRKAKAHPDYIGHALTRHEFGGKVCECGEFCGFASVLLDRPELGTTLIFEHIHFEII